MPVRQFVFTLPHRLRYLLAYDHAHCTAVVRIFARALLTYYRHRARQRGIASGRTGSVTFLQRFGSAANLNLHAHVLVLDGVFAPAPQGRLTFHPARPPERAELAGLLARVSARIARYLRRSGVAAYSASSPTSPATTIPLQIKLRRLRVAMPCRCQVAKRLAIELEQNCGPWVVSLVRFGRHRWAAITCTMTASIYTRR